MSRVNPFTDPSEAPTFTTKPKPPLSPATTSSVEQIAHDQGFPSRQARKAPAAAAKRPRRTYTTGRNQQINFKATPATIERFYRIADEKKLPLCETLELALDALDRLPR
jgi:hypothetical protein